MKRQLIMVSILLVFIMVAACKPKEKAPPPEPAYQAQKMKPRAELMEYLQRQIQIATRTVAGSPDMVEKNKTSYFGCLEKNKEDECRFMLCSPYAIYAGDELYYSGKFEDAFTYYAGAFDLMKMEVTTSIDKRKSRESEYQPKVDAGQATEQDKRHYLYRRAILAQGLYRADAELARIHERFAIIFDKQKKSTEAANARIARDTFVESSADEYQEYFKSRDAVLPLLDPKDPEKGSNYLSVIKELDSLLEVRHF